MRPPGVISPYISQFGSDLFVQLWSHRYFTPLGRGHLDAVVPVSDLMNVGVDGYNFPLKAQTRLARTVTWSSGGDECQTDLVQAH